MRCSLLLLATTTAADAAAVAAAVAFPISRIECYCSSVSLCIYGRTATMTTVGRAKMEEMEVTILQDRLGTIRERPNFSFFLFFCLRQTYASRAHASTIESRDARFAEKERQGRIEGKKERNRDSEW